MQDRVEVIGKRNVALTWVTSELMLPLALASLKSAIRSFKNSNVESKLSLVMITTGDQWSKKSTHLIQETAKHSPAPLIVHAAQLLASKSQHSHYPMGVFVKLQLPTLMADYSRVVYLDSDTEVVGDISELIGLDLGKNWIAVCRETTMQRYVANGTPAPKFTKVKTARDYVHHYLGIDVESYVNSGVMVIDSQSPEALEFAASALNQVASREFWFADQCVFSMLLSGDFSRLDPDWNYQMGDHWPRQTRPDAKLLHYSGVFRPWKIFLVPKTSLYLEDVVLHSKQISQMLPGRSGMFGKLGMTVAVAAYRKLPTPIGNYLRRIISLSR